METSQFAGIGMIFGLSMFVLGRKRIIISSDQIDDARHHNAKNHSIWKKSLSLPLVIALTDFSNLDYTTSHVGNSSKYHRDWLC